MADSITGVAVYLMPGMSVKLKSSLTNRNNFGYFAAEEIPRGYFSDMTNVSTITRGFVVEDERNGIISEATDEEGTVVIYTHKRIAANTIWFFGVGSKVRGLVNVISVPIHDHSSIVMGGPAYGTYFDDDVERVEA